MEYREGADPQLDAMRIAGRPHFGPARLRRGFRGDVDLYTEVFMEEVELLYDSLELIA